jgi:hypothetical protein
MSAFSGFLQRISEVGPTTIHARTQTHTFAFFDKTSLINFYVHANCDHFPP